MIQSNLSIFQLQIISFYFCSILKIFFNRYDAEEEPSFFEQLKEKVTKEAEESRKEFQNLDPSQRLLLEGFPIGTYVRIEISNMYVETQPSIQCKLFNLLYFF